MKEKIIIICPNIPPNPGIGGRRWAKFAKYLDRAGADVTLIGYRYKKATSTSNWIDDIDVFTKNGKLHLIPHRFPETLITPPTSLVGKIKYRIDLFKNKFLLKGNYYDSSAFWHNSLIPFLHTHIGDTPTTIIASGAPFTYLHSLLVLKKHEHIKLVADFRDPWVDNAIGYGYSSLTAKRFNFEKKLELEVLKGCDLLLNVNKEQQAYTAKRIGGTKKNIVLPNGYDRDDLKNLTPKERTNSNKISFVFGGTLYNDALYAFKLLIELLDDIKKEKPEIYNKLEFNFYGNKVRALKHHFEGTHSDVLFEHGSVPLNDMYQKIHDADFVMIFLTKAMNFTRNTKFLECINLNKKVLVFSNTGYLENHVREHHIGYSMTDITIKKSFNKLLRDYDEGNMSIPEEYDVSEYDIKNLTEKLIEHLEALNNRVS